MLQPYVESATTLSDIATKSVHMFCRRLTSLYSDSLYDCCDVLHILRLRTH